MTPAAMLKYYQSIGWKLMRWQLTTNAKGEVSKRPIDNDYQNKETTESDLLQWLEQGYNFGLLCDKSGLVVVDDDRERVGVTNDIELSSPIMVKTMRGGTHYYFKYPKDRRTHNDQNPETHIDIRANGWVAIPPSKGYEWLIPPVAELLESLPEFPQELEDKIRARKNKQSNVPNLVEIMSMKDGDGRNNAYHLWCCSEIRRAFNHKIRQFKKPGEKTDLETVKRVLQEVKSELDLLAQIKAKDFAEELNSQEADRTYQSAFKFTAKEIVSDYSGGKYDTYGKSGIKKTLTPSTKFSQMSEAEIKSYTKLQECPIEISTLANRFPFPTGFYILCAVPGAGKSWFTTWLARKMWEKAKLKTVIFTIEMSKNAIRKRILQSWSGLNKKEFEAGFDTSQAVKLLQQDILIVDDFSSDDQENQTIENFMTLFEAYYKDGYRVFHLDHVHEVDGAEIDFGTKALTKWANCFRDIKNTYPDVWLFMIAQPNAAAERKNKLTKMDFMGTKFPTKKCDYFLSLNKIAESDGKKGEFDLGDSVDRRVMLWIDKTRNTDETHFGTLMYFGWDGNFYSDEAEANLMNPSATTNQCLRRILE